MNTKNFLGLEVKLTPRFWSFEAAESYPVKATLQIFSFNSKQGKETRITEGYELFRFKVKASNRPTRLSKYEFAIKNT